MVGNFPFTKNVSDIPGHGRRQHPMQQNVDDWAEIQQKYPAEVPDVEKRDGIYSAEPLHAEGERTGTECPELLRKKPFKIHFAARRSR